MTTARTVAVDLLYFTGRKGGTETYARGLFPAIGEVAPWLRLLGLTSRELGGTVPDWFPGAVRQLPVSGENRVAWGLAEAALVGPAARRLGADVLHCPANFGPVVPVLPTVVTVHDLLPLKHPEWMPGRRARAVGRLSKASARAARRVLTDSEASADDLRRLAGVPGDRIDVVPLATTAARQHAATERAGRPLALATGNRLPHKNFEGLLHAWARMPAERRPLLVVTGSHGKDPLAPLVVQLGLDNDVELREWVPREELEALYATAAAYVCPSLFEGFGLPVLEAMQRGCPVVCTDLPVLREVGGEAVRYVDSSRADALAAAVLEVVEHHDVQQRLRAAGHARAATFSWRRVAEATVASYERALVAPSPR